MADPLQTRSLPGAPWASMPKEITSIDEAIAEALSTWFDNHTNFKFFVVQLTERPLGWLVLALLLLLMFYKSFDQTLFTQISRSRRLIFMANIGVVLLVSDFCSTTVKILIGRLKPHVDFYNPHYLPALSCPSNHSFNTACLLLFIFVSTRPLIAINKQKSLCVLIFLYWLLIGLSRVVLGQHYPIDVMLGGILGSALGAVSAKLMELLNAFAATRKKKSTSS